MIHAEVAHHSAEGATVGPLLDERATVGKPRMAAMPTSDDFARLESEVEKNPTSEDARENLLGALSADP